MVDQGSDPIKIEPFRLGTGVSGIRIEGFVSSPNLAQVEAALKEAFARGDHRIVVNLKGATYISSEGLGCFIGAHATAIRNGGRLVFAATPAPIRDAFNLVGLHQVFTFADDEEEAAKQLDA